MSDWNFDPIEISVLALAGALYWRRARTLAQRGRPIPRLRAAAFAAGLLTLFVALASPRHPKGGGRGV
jgi:cytochrome c oxidase assembly factor CtaG